MYTTLDAVKNELKATNTTDDTRLKGYIRTVSQRIDRMFSSARPLFEPYIEQRRIPIYPSVINSVQNLFFIEQSLFALSSLQVADDTVTSVEAWQQHLPYPAQHLHLTDDSLSWYTFCLSTNKPYTALITGTWGWHRDYSNAWVDLDALQAAISTTTATTLTVADVDGADEYGITPRFSYGNLIKVDSEYMLVIGTNTSTNVVTVMRGVNGSTAATHDNGATVSVWRVDDNIHRAATRQAAFLQARQGMFQGSTTTELGATVTFPQDLLLEVHAVMNEMSYA